MARTRTRDPRRGWRAGKAYKNKSRRGYDGRSDSTVRFLRRTIRQRIRSRVDLDEL